MNQKIDDIKNFSYQYLKDLAPIFGIKHMEQTFENITTLAEAENENISICQIASILHDIGLFHGVHFETETLQNNHGVLSAKMAQPFLTGIGLEEQLVNAICDAISNHCFPNRQKTVIAKLLWDADKLNMFCENMLAEFTKYYVKDGLSETEITGKIVTIQTSYISTFYTETAKKIADRQRRQENK